MNDYVIEIDGRFLRFSKENLSELCKEKKLDLEFGNSLKVQINMNYSIVNAVYGHGRNCLEDFNHCKPKFYKEIDSSEIEF